MTASQEYSSIVLSEACRGVCQETVPRACHVGATWQQKSGPRRVWSRLYFLDTHRDSQAGKAGTRQVPNDVNTLWLAELAGNSATDNTVGRTQWLRYRQGQMKRAPLRKRNNQQLAPS